jgi:AraC-like DNA-binding protein
MRRASIGDSSKFAALAALAAADTRKNFSHDLRAPASWCSLVCREREHVRAMRLERPAFVIVVEGGKEIWQDGRSWRFHAGDAFCLPARWQGDFINEPCPRSNVYRALFMDFSVELAERAFRAHPAWVGGPSAGAGAPCRVPVTSHLIDAVLHLATAFDGPRLPDHLIEHRAMEVLLILIDQGAVTLVIGGAGSKVSESVRTLLRMRPAHPWTAADLGREIGMSEASLRRHLSQEGTSLRHLLRSERMDHAQVLLHTEGTTVIEAAMASGYASRSHFARRFREAHGVPPSKATLAR